VPVPLALEPLEPLLPVLPVLPVLLECGTASINATVALGMAVALLPLAGGVGVCACAPVAPAMALPPLSLPEVPLVAELPLVPLVLLLPALPVALRLLPLPLAPLPAMLLPLSAPAGLPAALLDGLVPVLPAALSVDVAALLSVAPLRIELQPASAIASMPASTTLCCFEFMINSFGWYRYSGCT